MLTVLGVLRYDKLHLWKLPRHTGGRGKGRGRFMKKFGHMKNKVLKVLAIISSHHTGAYAAQAAYFFMLSPYCHRCNLIPR